MILFSGGSLIHFPLIKRLTVRDFGLYPGKDNSNIFELKLGHGPWLVLGVNGLGKSTLLLLMRYLLAGPVKTRNAGFAGERDDLQAVNNKFFAVRVADGAQKASGEIEVRLGDVSLTVERSLANLAIKRATIASPDRSKEITTEDEYRAEITSLAGVSQFEDFVRILDGLAFFLEARQPLIWDGAAQFEMFRALLTPNLSAELRRLEGEIVSADSTARNLSATLYKITQKRDKEAVKKETATDTRARISAIQGEIDALSREELRLVEEIENVETLRIDRRLQLKRSEKELDDATQNYEKLKFEALRQAFAGVKPTEQYVFLKMLSDRICIACNQPADSAAAELQKRSDDCRCVICGNPREYSDNIETISDVMRVRASDAYGTLEAKREELSVANASYVASNNEVYALQQKLSQVRFQGEEKASLIRRLRKNLPADENLALGREEERIAVLRREVVSFREEREKAEREIDELLETLKRATERVREMVENAFNLQAAPFFAEQVRLVYAPRTAKIGQGGRSFEFPAFEVEMTSGATFGQFVRRTPEQVSLSQRDYLDIIFRMTLLEILGNNQSSLIVDGPEGSLDAVFAGRAGNLFAKYSQDSESNILLACNIIEGAFVPNTLSSFAPEDRTSRVINLIEQAAPTQALTDLRPQYLQKVKDILLREPDR